MRKKTVLFALILAMAFGGGCKDKQKTLDTEFIRIRGAVFVPAQPVAGQDLRLKIDYQSPGKVQPKFSYRWYINGEMIQEGESDLLEGAKIISGGKIYAEYRASVGQFQTSWIKTEEMSVREPSVKITKLILEPESPTAEQTLTTVLECENCSGIKFYYRWKVNNAILDGQEEAELDGSAVGLKPGDEVMVEVSPETEYPEIWYNSPSVKVRNRAPEFSDQGKIWLDGKMLYFKASAFDPDGGSITYQLLEAPQGAQIDASGMVKWTVPSGFQGEVNFKVQAKDTNGGTNEITGAIQLSEQ